MSCDSPRRRDGRVIHRYAVFGLTLASEMALPDLRPGADDNADPDLTIRLGSFDAEEQLAGYHMRGEGVLLVVPEVARFRITGGRDMIVEPAAAAPMRDVRLFVLGSAMGVVLHQRGLLPLHANAVGIADGAVALLGHSGAGKSTLARWFHDAGHPVLSDDVCVVGQTGIVPPGIPRLRLWRDALEGSGRAADDYEQSYQRADKFDVPLLGAPPPPPMPLRAVYLLRRAETVAIAPLTGTRAVEALVANTYRGGFVRAAGLAAPHLAACMAVARRVPVFSFERRWDPRDFDADAEALLAHARALG